MTSDIPTGLFDQINYVTDLWQDPCLAPWHVYVETALPHALELFVNATTFGGADLASQASGFFEEVVEGIADPGGTGGSRKGKRGRIRGRYRNPLMRAPDAVAKRVPGFQQAQKLTDNDGGRTFFTFYNVFERAQLYWFLANLTRDNFVEWTTSLYQTPWCQDAGKPRVQYDGGGGGAIGLLGWQAPTARGVIGENGAQMIGGVVSLGGAPGRVFCSCSHDKESSNSDHSYGVRLVGQKSGVLAERIVSVAEGSAATVSVSGPVPRGETVECQVRVAGDVVVGDGCTIVASGSNAAQGRNIDAWF